MDQKQALQAALGIFLQYGYKKSSMEDIARAVGVSRQWMYQQFESKQVLFRETVTHALDAMLAHGVAGLKTGNDIEKQLVQAFDGWCGGFVDMLKMPHATEAIEAADSEHGEHIKQVQQDFESALAKAIKQSKVTLPTQVKPRDVASMLMAASVGIKYTCTSRDDYLKQMRQFIRIALGKRC